MDPFPITTARLVDLFAGCVLYGIHLVTLCNCLWCLMTTGTRFKTTSEINWPMIIVSSTLGAIASLDVAVALYHNLQAFVFSKGLGGAEQVLTNISSWENVMGTTTVVIQTVIGDGMLIYRCWVVYNRSWRVVTFSIILWLAGIVCTAIMIFLETRLHAHVLVNDVALIPYASSFWALTIVMNILTTGLLVKRLWQVDRERAKNQFSRHHRTSYLQRAMRSIIESGLMYTVVAFMTFVVYITRSNAIYVLAHSEIQIVGIAFDLIIIRVTKHDSDELVKTTDYNAHPIEFAPFPSTTTHTMPDTQPKGTETHPLDDLNSEGRREETGDQ